MTTTNDAEQADRAALTRNATIGSLVAAGASVAVWVSHAFPIWLAVALPAAGLALALLARSSGRRQGPVFDGRLSLIAAIASGVILFLAVPAAIVSAQLALAN